MQQHRVNLSSYQFRRSKCDGLIEVLNEGSYVMAEYSERTGLVKWQRVVLASQREQIERWLGEHYPVQAKPEPVVTKRAVPAPPARAHGRSGSKAKRAAR
jgi:hypothetical protein